MCFCARSQDALPDHGRRCTYHLIRLNHGSQLGRDDQIAYEFNVLQAVEASKVTPRPFRWSMDTGALADGIMQMDELRSKARLLERTILLRGLSWCYMAYYEYMRADRALAHLETEGTIKRYMSQVDWFLGLLR